MNDTTTAPGAETWDAETIGHTASRDEIAGFNALFDGQRRDFDKARDWQRGWEIAAQRAYGRGVKDYFDDGESPWPQFHPAWESWAAGWNATAGL